MKGSPKILIAGFGSVLNYGGEAIVHGTLRMIFEVWPSAKVTVATVDVDAANQALGIYDNVTVIQSHNRFTLHRLFRGVLRRLGLGEGSPVRVNPKIVDGHDIFLSVGGDNFVQQPDGSLSYILQDLVILGERAKKKGVIYCLWGASVGPFERMESYQRIADHLKKADLITVREALARDYVLKMGCSNNLITVADPAFCAGYDTSATIFERNPSDIVIGVNLSLLSLHHAHDIVSDKEMTNLVGVLHGLLEIAPKVKIVLIPHVVSSVGGSQDDYAFLRDLNNLCMESERMILLPFGLGARVTKGVMKDCDLVVAARMHCFIGSVSVGTPAIILAYSNKAYGLAQYVYGNQNYAIDIRHISSQALNHKVLDMLKDISKLRKHLEEGLTIWQDEARNAMVALKKLYLDSSAS